jgi:hypothetical protein
LLLQLWATPHKGATFIKERGMYEVAKLTVHIKEGGKDKVAIKLEFGQEELTISAVSKHSGERVAKTIKFTQNSFP